MYDYPDLRLTTGAYSRSRFDNDGLIQEPGLEVVAGLLYVPLSRGGKDFIAFLRRGQPRHVKWAGKPQKSNHESSLEPRTSFKVWSETVAGRCRAWTDEQLETAGVLALVYGKVCTHFLLISSCLTCHRSSLKCGGRKKAHFRRRN